MFRLQRNWNMVFCFCCTVYVTVSGVLPFCGSCVLLIKFPVEKCIVFIKQKREHFTQSTFCLINLCVLGIFLPATSQVFIPADPPQTHHVERSFVSMLELSCPLLVLFVFPPWLIIIQPCGCRWCGWLLPSAFGFSFHQPHSYRLPGCSHFLLLVCGFRCMFSIWKKTPLSLWGKF